MNTLIKQLQVQLALDLRVSFNQNLEAPVQEEGALTIEKLIRLHQTNTTAAE